MPHPPGPIEPSRGHAHSPAASPKSLWERASLAIFGLGRENVVPPPPDEVRKDLVDNAAHVAVVPLDNASDVAEVSLNDAAQVAAASERVRGDISSAANSARQKLLRNGVDALVAVSKSINAEPTYADALWNFFCKYPCTIIGGGLGALLYFFAAPVMGGLEAAYAAYKSGARWKAVGLAGVAGCLVGFTPYGQGALTVLGAYRGAKALKATAQAASAGWESVKDKATALRDNLYAALATIQQKCGRGAAVPNAAVAQDAVAAQQTPPPADGAVPLR